MSDTREMALPERLREAITVLDEPYHREAVAHVIEEAAAALAASPAPTLAQWQPIETAPKDGTHVLLYREDWADDIAAGWYSHDWMQSNGTWFLGATHWMPLPDPPAAIHARETAPCLPIPQALSLTKAGIRVDCAVCHRIKNPIGRSGPLVADYCDHECPGYRQPPYVGSLWPNETEAAFGYPVGNDGTTESRETAEARGPEGA